MRKYWLLSCAFLLSCTVGPDYENNPVYSDETIKNELKLSQSGNSDYAWPTLFDDVQFRQLLAQGLQNSTDVKTDTHGTEHLIECENGNIKTKAGTSNASNQYGNIFAANRFAGRISI